MSDEIVVESLINEVKQYPELWKISAEEYRDKVKKRASWFKICEVFYSDFNQKSEAEQDKLGRKLSSRWRNIKDTFMKREKRKSGRRYIYASKLSFLRENEDRSATRSSFDIEEVTATEPPIEMSSAEGACLDSSKIQPSRNRRTTKRRRDLEESLINFINTSIPSTTTAEVPEVDEDKSFFDSLLPTVKTFTIDQKLEFRSEVLNIAKKIRYSFLASSHQSAPRHQSLPFHSFDHQNISFPFTHQFNQQSVSSKVKSSATTRATGSSQIRNLSSNISHNSEDSHESTDTFGLN